MGKVGGRMNHIPFEFVDSILNIIEKCPQHKFLILTKRPERALEYFSKKKAPDNVWLGVSISTQKEADEKIPILLQTPAAHRYVNLGPMLEYINLQRAFGTEGPRQTFIEQLDWITLECESGPGRRPMELEWARSIAEQCKATGIPLWIKQLTIETYIIISRQYNYYISKNMAEWPEDLRIREIPWQE